jgi:hypothetical protein
MVVQGCPELVYAVWHDAVWLSAEFEFTGKNNRVARNEQVSHADFFFSSLEITRYKVDRQIVISVLQARKYSHSFLPPFNKNSDTVGCPKIG